MAPEPIEWPDGVMVVVPAYNAAAALERFLAELLSAVFATHVCVVDDGSEDETRDVCRRAGVLCIAHHVNRGKGAALMRGFNEAIRRDMKWVITMDADGQHSPRDIGAFLAKARNSGDGTLIIGRRSMTPGRMPVERIVSNTVTSAFLSLLTGRKILDSQSGFRMYPARLLRSVQCTHKRFEMESEVILRACSDGFDIGFVPIQTLYCSDQSHISHVLDTFRWVRAVVGVWLELRMKRQNSR